MVYDVVIFCRSRLEGRERDEGGESMAGKEYTKHTSKERKRETGRSERERMVGELGKKIYQNAANG